MRNSYQNRLAMDHLFFLKERTTFIRRFYGQARQPFDDAMRKIQAGEPPFDQPPYSEDPEPPYLVEYSEANDSARIVGLTCVSMLSASLKLFVVERHREVFQLTQDEKKVLGKLGFIRGYRKVLAASGIPIDHAPVNFVLLEEIDLARNQAQHPDRLTDINARYSEHALNKVSSPIFVSDREAQILSETDANGVTRWLMQPQVDVSPQAMNRAIDEVERFCEWFDSWLTDEYEQIRKVLSGAATALPPNAAP